MSKLRLLQAAAVAEKAWMAEVEQIFGARDADGGYAGVLRRLRDALAT